MSPFDMTQSTDTASETIGRTQASVGLSSTHECYGGRTRAA